MSCQDGSINVKTGPASYCGILENKEEIISGEISFDEAFKETKRVIL